MCCESESIPSENIQNLLISTAENGVSTHETFLAAMKEFDEYFQEYGEGGQLKID